MWCRASRRVAWEKGLCVITGRRERRGERVTKARNRKARVQSRAPAREEEMPRSRMQHRGPDGPAPGVALASAPRDASRSAEALIEKIRSRQAKLAVIGLGYVGLPLACEFARGGITVEGIDVDSGRVAGLKSGRSHVQDVPDEHLTALIRDGILRPTDDFSVLAGCDACIICVPTPLRKTRDPDISYIVAAVEEVARYLHPGFLVVLESTTYPGTTEEVLLPKLGATGLKI